jgi:galactokinase
MVTKPFNVYPPSELADEFEKVLGAEPDFTVRAPATIDVLGGPAVQDDGWTLTVAIDRYTWLAVQKLPTTLVTVHRLGYEAEDEAVFRLTDLDEKRTIGGDPLPGWAEYIAGVAWSFQEAGQPTPGTRLALAAGIPPEGGLGAATAIEVACATAWAHITSWDPARMALAKVCQRAGTAYVGVESGLYEHVTALFAQEAQTLVLDGRAEEWGSFPFPNDVSFVIAETGQRSHVDLLAHHDACHHAFEALREVLPHIITLRDVSLEEYEQHADVVAPEARRCVRHVIGESARVLEASRALHDFEPAELGSMMDESYQSAQSALGVDDPALFALWQASQGHGARLGGRPVHLGTTGQMAFLVKAGGAVDFAEHTAHEYREATGQDAIIYPVEVVGGTQTQPDRSI